MYNNQWGELIFCLGANVVRYSDNDPWKLTDIIITAGSGEHERKTTALRKFWVLFHSFLSRTNSENLWKNQFGLWEKSVWASKLDLEDLFRSVTSNIFLKKNRDFTWKVKHLNGWVSYKHSSDKISTKTAMLRGNFFYALIESNK